MGAAVCWSAALQACVTLSTAEAEMVALSKAAQEVVWFRRLMYDLREEDLPPSLIYCDNNATLGLIKNRVHHSRTKHIKLRQNWVLEHTNAGEIEPTYIPTDINLADSFTKPIKKSILEEHFTYLTGMELTYCD